MYLEAAVRGGKKCKSVRHREQAGVSEGKMNENDTLKGETSLTGNIYETKKKNDKADKTKQRE